MRKPSETPTKRSERTSGGPIRERDEIFVPAGRSRTAFVDARDVGRVAAVTLAQPGHIGKAYTLSGEQSRSYRNVAAIMSEVLGRPIRYNRPREDLYLARLAAEDATRGLHRGAENDPPRPDDSRREFGKIRIQTSGRHSGHGDVSRQ